MHLTAALTLARRRARTREAGAHRRPPAEQPALPPVPPRRIDPPQDAAFYVCVCGFAWTGAVTTSIGCPHCGTGQAW